MLFEARCRVERSPEGRCGGPLAGQVRCRSSDRGQGLYVPEIEAGRCRLDARVSDRGRLILPCLGERTWGSLGLFSGPHSRKSSFHFGGAGLFGTTLGVAAPELRLPHRVRILNQGTGGASRGFLPEMVLSVWVRTVFLTHRDFRRLGRSSDIYWDQWDRFHRAGELLPEFVKSAAFGIPSFWTEESLSIWDRLDEPPIDAPKTCGRGACTAAAEPFLPPASVSSVTCVLGVRHPRMWAIRHS